MAKTKEASAEALAQDLARLRGLHEEAKGRITSLERELGLLQERDAELARRGFQGEDVRKERAKLQETLDAKARELDRERRDLGILEQELHRVEVDHAAAQRQADEARAKALAAAVAAETAGLAQDLREALTPPLARLERAEKVHVELQALWEDLDRGQFLGGQSLVRVRYLADELLKHLQAMEGPR